MKTHRLSLRYAVNGPLKIAHLLEVGDGPRPATKAEASCRELPHGIEVTLEGARFRFADEAPFAVERENGRVP